MQYRRKQALTQYLTDNNSVGINETGLTNADLDNSVLPFMKKYFKVVNDCGDKTAPCFAANYKSLSGTVITAGCGDPSDPGDVDGIGRLIGNGWNMDY